MRLSIGPIVVLLRWDRERGGVEVGIAAPDEMVIVKGPILVDPATDAVTDAVLTANLLREPRRP